MLWPSVVSKLELARADVKAMIKVYDSGPKWRWSKETKFFRKQAEKAERMARATSDEEASQNLTNLAMAYRSQADALKKNKKKSGKKAGLKAKGKWARGGKPSLYPRPVQADRPNRQSEPVVSCRLAQGTADRRGVRLISINTTLSHPL
jgi:hypothetical protein